MQFHDYQRIFQILQFQKPMKHIHKFAFLFTLLVATYSQANSQDSMLGEVRMFAGNFAPRGWAACDGQILPIAQHQALFSLLGTTYGGDGRVTFALPDLRGRAPIHMGQDPNQNKIRLGQNNNGIPINPNSEGGQSTTTPTLAITYIICLEGFYPSRS